MAKIRFKSQAVGHEPRATNHGSALIIAVILTSLLAIIGMMFVMVARVDKMATSSISGNKELNSAVAVVVAKISQELVLDVPGVAGQEYYDYPDAYNPWLASIEPYDDSGTYRWRQISDVTGYLKNKNFAVQYVLVDPPGARKVIREYPDIILDNNGDLATGNSDDGKLNNEPRGQLADADGDGIADSKWIELENITSGRGKPIYAAVRVIDNGAMINVNTAYEFDPGSSDAARIDGNSQMQINLDGLLRGTDTIDDANNARNPDNNSYSQYQDGLIWRIEDPCSNYTPFDISDELELRYRYCIDSKLKSRVEAALPDTADAYGDPGGLYNADNGWGLSNWQQRITDPYYANKADRRHMLTTCNLDRIIDPCGAKMTNINSADPCSIYEAVKSALGSGYPNVDAVAAQMAVDINDYRDDDSDVSNIDISGVRYYGFENQPFISEIAALIDTSDPTKNCYAVELYNPFNKPISLNGFILSIESGTNIPLDGTKTIDPNGYFVISNDLTKFSIDAAAATQQNAGLIFSDNYADTSVPPDGLFDTWNEYDVTLKRTVDLTDIILDFQTTDNTWFTPDAPNVRYAQRDTTNWQVIYDQSMVATATGKLGTSSAVPPVNKKNYNLTLANDKFVTIGDIARPLIVGPSTNANNRIGAILALEPGEDAVRLNLQVAAFGPIFNYLTVFDPNDHRYGGHPAAETRVKGRININTAPWFVLAQLPWVSKRVGGYGNPALAQAIVAYRDKLDLTSTGGYDYRWRLGQLGFVNIGQLNKVVSGSDNNYCIDYYKRDSADLTGFPDLTPGGTVGDDAVDDYEERDVIFSRISNLVTVRSDVFTAYILVRIGVDGPQKRVMAILDRSNVYLPTDKVRIIALHPVPDPR